MDPGLKEKEVELPQRFDQKIQSNLSGWIEMKNCPEGWLQSESTPVSKQGGAMRDWVEVATPKVDTSKQSSLAGWVEKKTIPEGRQNEEVTTEV